MKLYSDTLTYDDLQAALPAGVYIDGLATSRIRKPRVRRNGWNVVLSGTSTHPRNSGTHGAARWPNSPPATYDEHGRWMARLFDIDPDARIAYYDGREDFHRSTRDAYAAVA